MNSLRDTPERIEQHFGEAVLARDDAIKRLGRKEGIGPPDLCWVRKYATNTLGFRTGEPQGFYHWVQGLEMSSAASVAAYFAQLTKLQENPSLLQGLIMTQEWHMDGAIYCCYDAFHRIDLRCKFTFPGTVEVQAMDGAGNLLLPTELMWHAAHVSSFLRAALLDVRTISELQSYRRLEFAATPDLEKALLESVSKLFEVGLLPSQLPWLQAWDPYGGIVAEDMDLLGAALLHHFRYRQRLPQASEFFSKLLPHWPEAAVYVAAAERSLGDPARAINVLQDRIDTAGASCQLLTALGSATLEGGDPWFSVLCAAEALDLDPTCRPAWYLLSKALLRVKGYAAALKALNRAPPPPEHTLTLQQRLLFAVPPQEYAYTAPKSMTLDPDAELLGLLDTERDRPTEIIGDLPAEEMFPREPIECGFESDAAFGRGADCVSGRIYSLLVDIVEEAGWESFLSFRAQAFLMAGDDSTVLEEVLNKNDPLRPKLKDSIDGEHELHLLQEEVRSKSVTGQHPAATSAAAAVKNKGRGGGAAQGAAEGSGTEAADEIIEDFLTKLTPGYKDSRKSVGDKGKMGKDERSLAKERAGAGSGEVPPSTAQNVDRSAKSQRTSSSGALETSGPSTSSAPPAEGPPPRAPGSKGATRRVDSSDALHTARNTEVPPGGFAGILAAAPPLGPAVDRTLASLSAGKEECSPFLDDLITALFVDLRQHRKFCEVERRLKRAVGRDESEGGAGTDDDSSDADHESEIAGDRTHGNITQQEWVLFGILSERIKEPLDVERSYRVSASMAPPSLLATTGLARIYAEKGWVHECLACLVTLLNTPARTRAPKSPTGLKGTGLRVAATCFFVLVVQAGLQAVRDEVAKIKKLADAQGASSHPGAAAFLQHLLNEALKWHTEGYDK